MDFKTICPHCNKQIDLNRNRFTIVDFDTLGRLDKILGLLKEIMWKKEIVLSPEEAKGLRALINGPKTGKDGFVFVPKINALDSKGVDRVLKLHGAKFFKKNKRRREDK